MIQSEIFPANPVERSRWVVERRGPRNVVSGDLAYAQLLEKERTDNGEIAQVATIFLTNRECPWKCVMCDLWRNTVAVPAGAVPKQIERSLETLGGASVLKLYNSGSFFDVGAIPKSDWKEIAALVRGFAQVVVECHPRLVGRNVLEFAELLDAPLEIAMGLETCHPEALKKLNKRLTVDDFRRATKFLLEKGISVRTFLLVGVPFIETREQERWLEGSIVEAFNAGANVVSLIPTRSGNGALDALETAGEFLEPRLASLEAAQAFGITLRRGRVFADSWDLARFCRCDKCAPPRRERLIRMNLSQDLEPRIQCDCEE